MSKRLAFGWFSLALVTLILRTSLWQASKFSSVTFFNPRPPCSSTTRHTSQIIEGKFYISQSFLTFDYLGCVPQEFVHVLAELAAGQHIEDHPDGVQLEFSQFVRPHPSRAVHDPSVKSNLINKNHDIATTTMSRTGKCLNQGHWPAFSQRHLKD